MSWAQALRSYLASPPYLRCRDGAGVFDCVCRAHLQGFPGHTVDAYALSLLRQLRGELLKNGTPERKANTLETILACYSTANRLYTYDDVRSARENHLLTLEQLQCLVEARLAGVPVRVSHYRFLMRSPQLSQLSPNLPLLLFREMTNAEGGLSDDVRVDVGMGLALGGHWKSALEVCPRSRFLDVIERVASLQRHGWRHACALVSHLKDEVVTQDEGYLVSVVVALALWFAVSRDLAIGSRMEKLIRTYSCQNGGKPPPKRAIDCFLSSSSPGQWRVAMEFLVHYNSKVEDTARIPLGKVMALMNNAMQWERVLLLYQVTPPLFAANECRHAAVHNNALMALAKGNLWQRAIRFYASQTVKNLHTYNVWLRIATLEGRVPFAAAWESCVRAYQRLENPGHRYAEGLALRLGSIGAWVAALGVAKAAAERIPRVLLTGVSVAAAACNERAAWQAAKELGSCRRELSAKQLCTAAAIVGCCTKGVPHDVSDALGEALRTSTLSQQQFDEAVCHLGQCMALLHGKIRDQRGAGTPPAIRLLLEAGRGERTAASWAFALELLLKASGGTWSLGAAAPAMLSSGLGASVAIRFLPV
ncbi:hypothetical protein TraAM80_08426 [Trypanosoma rangeli]|uniref:Uncharacterized protein n=1 Tax=Trypanosoma rangeli TaxID=5698 RepID=A0A422N0R2_TRYRA|nr:uncharacterized protein TraAM80_08426 [Trypanosoma rangeli]RNE99051.1 hypothetical protein TraAM80_08426 [Trypanosoma rangeli]|eukprot:RNE99051.1 hypothetical protein TraAM80_08426 [Trypanosoma rangeli]